MNLCGENMIKLDNVTKIIKKNKVINNVSLELFPGKVYGFYGKNGSGKTMLLRLISGLVKSTEGTISVGGKVIGKDIDYPSDIGLLIEHPKFIDYFTGFENLKFIARILNKISDKDIIDAMERVGLDSQDTRKYKEYSIGMKQRLGIAQAVMERPLILLLDEPTNSIDEGSVKEIYSMLEELKEQGTLIVIVEHNKENLSYISDEIYMVNKGEVTNE